MLLTRANINAHRLLRRQIAAGAEIGPPRAILASDVLLAACRAAGVSPVDLIARLRRTRSFPEVARSSSTFQPLRPELPNCTYVRLQSGMFQVRCDGDAAYHEETALPRLILYGRSVPETVIAAARGRRLSQLVDVSTFPALARVDPIVRRIANRCHAGTGMDQRVELMLEVEWHPLA